MATKPEANFIIRIHRKLDTVLYKQAMGLTATNGTPDYYYEGRNGVLWVEYKWYPKKPTVVELYDTDKYPHLSRLQQNWLTRAHNNGVPVAVVAGYPKGCLVFNGLDWTRRWQLALHDVRMKSEFEWADTLNELNV